MITKKGQAELDKQLAILRLRELCPPGSTILCVLDHVSRSGMSRRITFYANDADTSYLNGYIAKLGHYKQPANSDSLRVDGCGMDMGFAVVYDIGATIYGDGFECLGDRCPSNDHSNGDRDYSPHMHSSGGYSLKHRWL